MNFKQKKNVHRAKLSQPKFNVFTNSSPEIFSLIKKLAPFTSGHVKLFFLGRVNVRVSTYFKSVTIIIMPLSIYNLSNIRHRIFFDDFLASDNRLSIFCSLSACTLLNSMYTNIALSEYIHCIIEEGYLYFLWFHDCVSIDQQYFECLCLMTA